MMRSITLSVLLTLAFLPAFAANPAGPQLPPNPLIDYAKFSRQVAEVEKLRLTHRVTEQQFLDMSRDSGTIVLDARSAEKFNMLHIAGAKHLAFSDITAEELTKVIPSKETRILIYCNNNFLNERVAFASKMPTASLNIHSFNTLYAYGYRNIYELGPLIDINKTILPFEGTRAKKR